MKEQLPFITAYQPEAIKNSLRKRPDLLAEMLLNLEVKEINKLDF